MGDTHHIKQLDSLFHEAPIPMLIFSASQNSLVYKNKYCLSVASLTIANEVISWDVLVAQLVSRFEQGEPINIEAKAGDRIYSFALNKVDADYCIYGNDVTKLVTARDFYFNVLNNLPADIGVFNAQRQYIFVNPNGIKDKNLREWIIGKTDFDYCEYRNKPFTMAEQRKTIVDNVLLNKKEYGYEEEILTAEGKRLFQLRRLFPVMDTDGAIKFIIGYGLNITDRKLAEERTALSEKRFREIFDYSLALICIHDAMGIILDVNPALCKSLEYDISELKGKSIKEFIDPETKYFFEDNYLKPINTEGETKGVFMVISKSGQRKYLLYQNYLVQEGTAEPFVIGFSQDITEIKKAEWAQKKANIMVESSVKAKEDFLASITHEIRTPMNAIMGMTRQLGKTSLQPEQQSFLNAIATASSNLLVLINDILDLSKIEAGKLRLERIAFSFDEVNENVKALVKEKAKEKNLELHFSIDAQISPVLIGDPYRISQVMINLLGNALKFTEKGSITAKISLAKEDEQTQLIEIAIIDTGIGMSEKFMRDLFQKFSQEDESVTRKYGGTGLGMNITKQLVELMSGTISVESKKYEGTKFTITLLLKKGSKEDIASGAISAINKDALKGKVILLADDNELNRFVATATIKDYGATLILAEDGREAIEKIKQNKAIQIVLMDVHMPDIDGMQATEIIRREISSSLPVLAMSAGLSVAERERCIDVGVNDFINKPYKEEELVNAILHWIGDRIVIPLQAGEQENTHQNTSSLFSLSRIREMSHGDTSFEREVIDIFIKDAMLVSQRLNEGLAKKDYKDISLAAHKIKSSAKLLDIDAIIEPLQTLEDIKETASPDIALIAVLIAEVVRVLNDVSRQLSLLENSYFRT